MEAHRLLAMLVLVLGCALGSGPASASAPAQSPQHKAPAQIKYSQIVEAQVVIIDAAEIAWKAVGRSDSRKVRSGAFSLPVKNRSLATEFGPPQPYLIVDYP